MTVTFFGHRSAPQDIASPLRNVLVDLIENKGANRFFVGNEGNFDKTVQRVLQELASMYSHIQYTVMLAYMPSNHIHYYQEEMHSALPEGMETVPPRFAISYRNQWMIEHSDTVVTYVTHSIGGAAMYEKLSKKKGKQLICLG